VQDLNRRTGVGLLDLSDGDDDDDGDHSSETSGDSNNTEDQVVASTMAATLRRRSVEVGDRRSVVNNLTSNPSSTTPLSPLGGRQENIIAEGQVWDRMVNDLAIGAGVSGSSSGDTSHSLQQQGDGGVFSHQRGISGGIAASMLALSAAIPRQESQWSSSASGSGSVPPRLLPHPIWARRYPGAAGEWLRDELARRASGSSTQSHTTTQTSSTTSIPRPAAHAPPRWRNTSASNPQNEQRSSSNNAVLPATQIRIVPSPVSNPLNDLFSDPNARSRSSARRSNWDWNVLRFPSLDPSSRERGTGNEIQEQPPIESVRGDDANTSTIIPSGNALTVPTNNNALNPTPPPVGPLSLREDQTPNEISETFGAGSTERGNAAPEADSRETNRANVINSDAATLVARMAQASRDMAAARANIQVNNSEDRTNDSSSSNNSRTLRNGMSYIRRLRQLDGLESPSEPSIAVLPSEDVVEPSSPPRPYEVFPWYQPPRLNLGAEVGSQHQSAEEKGEDEDRFDPDGANLSWYQMARERMTAQSTLDIQEINDDPDGERWEVEVAAENEHGLNTLGVRRRVVAGSGAGASQRARNRSALVMLDNSDLSGSNESRSHTRGEGWNASEGWTLVDQRPMSPVRRSRDEGSESVTTWLREPANPTGRFSTSPLPINEAESPNASTTTRSVHTYRPVPATDDPRTTRRPRRLASLTDNDGHRFHLSDGTEGREVREGTPSPEMMPNDVGYARRLLGNDSSSLGRTRQLTSIGRRLDEEFRARQVELRQREDRLRSEVARRRVELDQARRRAGRIGRVVDRNRRQSNFTEVEGGVQNEVIGGGEAALPFSNNTLEGSNIETLTETTPLLGEQESSLIRRRALREPRLSRRGALDVNTVSTRQEAEAELTPRTGPPTPLQELLARLSMNSTQMHFEAERSLRRINSWSVSMSEHPLRDSARLEVTSFDDHATLPARSHQTLGRQHRRQEPTSEILQQQQPQQRSEPDEIDCLPLHIR